MDDIQSFIQTAVGMVQRVRHAVGDHGHVSRQCRDESGQFGCGSKTVFESTMLFDDVVARERPAVGRMSFLDVDDNEVGEVCVVGRHSADAVKLGHERWSAAATED